MSDQQHRFSDTRGRRDLKVALQLYTVRDDMGKDMEGTLQRVKDMGYDHVEFAGYFGRTADEVRSMLDRYGLECPSVHQGYPPFLSESEETVAYLKTLGATYSAIPSIGRDHHKGSERFEKTVEEVSRVGRLLREAGMTLLYHNHEYEFEVYDGKTLFDWLFESVPSDLLHPQIDTCWVRFAGYDPVELIRKYSGRVPVLHLKDFDAKDFSGGPVYSLIDDTGKETKTKSPSREESGFRFMPLGQGVQDFRSILQAAEEAGTNTVVVEQDACYETPAMEVVRISREYLRTLGL